MRLIYKRRRWEASVTGPGEVTLKRSDGKVTKHDVIIVPNARQMKDNVALIKAAIDVFLQKKDLAWVRRYRAYLATSRLRCKKWREKNPSKVRAYRNRTRRHRQVYMKEYMKRYRERQRAA